MTRATRHHELGFTLIELAAVLVLIGLLAGMAALSLAGPYRTARLADVVDQFRGFDATCRLDAQRWNRQLEMIFNLNNSTLSRREAASDETRSASIELPRGFVIDRVVVLDAPDEPYGRSSHEVTLVCSAHGWTPSYAVKIRGPEGTTKILVFAGMTGQMTILDSDKELHDVQALLQP